MDSLRRMSERCDRSNILWMLLRLDCKIYNVWFTWCERRILRMMLVSRTAHQYRFWKSPRTSQTLLATLKYRLPLYDISYHNQALLFSTLRAITLTRSMSEISNSSWTLALACKNRRLMLLEDVRSGGLWRKWCSSSILHSGNCEPQQFDCEPQQLSRLIVSTMYMLQRDLTPTHSYWLCLSIFIDADNDLFKTVYKISWDRDSKLDF